MNEISDIRVSDLPHSIEAEQAVLGTLLLDNSGLDRIADILKPEAFFDPVHALLFERMRARISANLLASPITMAPLMAGTGLDDLGGGRYLVNLSMACVSPKALRDYAVMLVELQARRALIQAAEEAAAGARSGADLGQTVSQLGYALSTMPTDRGQEPSLSLLKAITQAIQAINEAYQGNTTFLKTGIGALDSILKGLGPGDFCVMGGATSMGKTATGVEIARAVAVEQGKRVAYWSREMTAEQLATRMAASICGVPYSVLRDAGNLSEGQFRSFIEAGKSLDKAPLSIVPKWIEDITAGEASLRAVARRQGGLDLVIVDYAQLIRAQGKGRYEQMTEVSIRLKGLAGALNCPLIGMVQLDRNLIERDERRPQLADIKETGQFENDADQAVFCHREEYYLDRLGPKRGKDGRVSSESALDWQAQRDRWKDRMELIVRKNRHGSIATAEVGFSAPTNHFWALGEQQEIAF